MCVHREIILLFVKCVSEIQGFRLFQRSCVGRRAIDNPLQELSQTVWAFTLQYLLWDVYFFIERTTLILYLCIFNAKTCPFNLFYFLQIVDSWRDRSKVGETKEGERLLYWVSEDCEGDWTPQQTIHCLAGETSV